MGFQGQKTHWTTPMGFLTLKTHKIMVLKNKNKKQVK